MADKESTLSIVIRTVDRATAGLRKVNAAIKEIGTGLFLLTVPARMVGERIGALAKEAGLHKVAAGFRGVGVAAKTVFDRLRGNLLGLGVGVGVAVAGLRRLVDEFDSLGDKAEALGVGVDFLAQMRFAAEKSGASADQLDSGLKNLSQNMGQLRAGGGKMKKFLETVSPALLRQVKATRSNEQAFLLLARAFDKVTDPAKRAALAQNVFGDSELAPLLARGATGIEELRKRFGDFAGSQVEAAKAAGEVDDAMKDLDAAVLGVKGALVRGLGPALRTLVDELATWFKDNRARIGEWARDFGEKLPDRIRGFVAWFRRALDVASKFVDAIGGMRTVAILLGAAIMGPLITSVIKLGTALLTNPIGIIAAAIGTAAFLIIDNWTPISAFFVSLWDTVTGAFRRAWDTIKPIVDKISGAASTVLDVINPFDVASRVPKVPVQTVVNKAIADIQAKQQTLDANLHVSFANAPRGMRAAADPRNPFAIDTTMGFQMMGFP